VLVTIRKFAVIVALVLLALIAAVFASANPGALPIDIGFMRFESVPVAIALVVAFAFGWVFGLGCAAFVLFRLARERRQMRRDLRFAEAELSSLRSLPLNDAN
jgi:lipopolysaccharide assembly protein A